MGDSSRGALSWADLVRLMPQHTHGICCRVHSKKFRLLFFHAELENDYYLSMLGAQHEQGALSQALCRDTKTPPVAPSMPGAAASSAVLVCESCEGAALSSEGCRA